MNIYLVRHAESLSREGMDYEQASSVSLSEYGKKEARVLKKKIDRLKPDIIFSSPLARALETAGIITPSGTDIHIDERLSECAPSRSLTGRAYKEVKNRTRSEHDWKSDDGESFNECASRFIAFLDDVTDDGYRNVVVVSHALIIEAALYNLFSLSHLPHVGTTSTSLIEKKENDSFKLVFVNKKPLFFARILKAVLARLS